MTPSPEQSHLCKWRSFFRVDIAEVTTSGRPSTIPRPPNHLGLQGNRKIHSFAHRDLIFSDVTAEWKHSIFYIQFRQKVQRLSAWISRSAQIRRENPTQPPKQTTGSSDIISGFHSIGDTGMR
jgi:hypothetical protein